MMTGNMTAHPPDFAVRAGIHAGTMKSAWTAQTQSISMVQAYQAVCATRFALGVANPNPV
ncbi:hypothetical protein D3C81_1868890 [compost metagenome]